MPNLKIATTPFINSFKYNSFIFRIFLLLKNTYFHSYMKRVWDKSLTLNIKSEQNELSDTQNTVLFAFLSNLSILKIYNKEFLKSKSFCPNLFLYLFHVTFKFFLTLFNCIFAFLFPFSLSFSKLRACNDICLQSHVLVVASSSFDTN